MWVLFMFLACLGSKVATDYSQDTQAVIVEDLGPSFEYCENSPGHHACNFETIDETGFPVELYDFYGAPIVLDLSAVWCGPCNAAAQDVQLMHERFESAGLIYMTVLIENSQREPPTEEDLLLWKERHGIIDPPVLGSSRELLNNADVTQGWFLQGWPTFYFLDSDLVIQGYMRGYYEQGLLEGISLIIE